MRRHSHAQHFIDRLLEGYGWHGEHYFQLKLRLVSLYVDQFPENDLARDRERRHGVPIYGSIAEALTRGTNQLDVDGVVIIAEHGQYPTNAKGQKQYLAIVSSRRWWRCSREAGERTVFNDKHYSTRWEECVEMVEDSHRLGFPLLAGSSLPVTWRIPSIDMPWNSDLKESVCVCYGGVDSYDIHGLETAQCMSERRHGGEAGVRSRHAMRGKKVWDQLASRDDRATYRRAESQPPMPPSFG